MSTFREIRARHLADEVGTLHKQAGLAVALVYPSPYHVGMSSLGFQTIYRELHALPDVTAERAFRPEDVAGARQRREGLATYESARPVGDFPIIAFSLAYELELAGLVDCLDLAGVPALGAERGLRPDRHPLVVVGGPLTFSNPVPAGPYADVILMGEAEELVATLTAAVRDERDRGTLLAGLAPLPGFYVPPIHRQRPPAIPAAPHDRPPPRSPVRTPHTQLSHMFL